MDALTQIDIKNLPLIKTGKVRSVYDLGDSLLFVASDRVSAFDFILPTGIPLKGKVLSGISVFWFNHFKDTMPSHFLKSDVSAISGISSEDKTCLEGRSMIVKKCKVIPFECIVRGYISGSAWKEYKSSGTVNGQVISQTLKESQKFDTPLFTPTTKADEGHDEPVTFEEVAAVLGNETAEILRDKSIALFNQASEYLERKGIILADTKFEFGIDESGNILLIDEIFTPDSSRFWPKSSYVIGKGQDSYDKQIVRDYLLGLDWNKQAPVPALPPEIVSKTVAKYAEIYELITGKTI